MHWLQADVGYIVANIYSCFINGMLMLCCRSIFYSVTIPERVNLKKNLYRHLLTMVGVAKEWGGQVTIYVRICRTSSIVKSIFMFSD